MRIGLIDVDSHNFPNIPLMKISAWHKQKGDHVEWYDPWIGLVDEYDKVYVSKVFSFSPDYEHPIYAKEIQRGGQDTALRSLTERRYMTRMQIYLSLMRLNISILTTRSITARSKGLRIRHMGG